MHSEVARKLDLGPIDPKLFHYLHFGLSFQFGFEVCLRINLLLFSSYSILSHFRNNETGFVSESNFRLTRWTFVFGSEHIFQARFVQMMVALNQLQARLSVYNFALTKSTLNHVNLVVALRRWMCLFKSHSQPLMHRYYVRLIFEGK